MPPGFFGGTVYEDSEWRIVTTTLPCGCIIRATPDGCDIDPASCGYEDAWALTQDHDPCHVWLASALGLMTTPTLERKVHYHRPLHTWAASDDLVALEEAAVAAVLAYRNAAIKEGFGVLVFGERDVRTQPYVEAASDPFTQEAQLCDEDGLVWAGGPVYSCTGHAHAEGEHIRCTNPIHEVPPPPPMTTTTEMPA